MNTDSIKFYLSIDIGIINLGYVYGYVNNNENNNKLLNNYCFLNTSKLNSQITILECNNVNITIMKHSVIPFKDCKLCHDNCVSDYVDHFIQEKKSMFDKAETILIERQPITGITNVQDLLMNKFRKKVILISPNKIHKYFNMSKNYYIRKLQSEKIALEYLTEQYNFVNNIRKHDIADALLIFIYYYISSTTNNNQVNNTINNKIIDLEKFRFVKKITK